MGQTIYLFGNVGKDPEVKTVGDQGTKMATFSVATKSPTGKRDEEGKAVYRTEWMNCKVWRDAADKVERLMRKGDTVAICGELHTSSWDDKDGNKKYRTDIEVNWPGNIVIEAKQPQSDGY